MVILFHYWVVSLKQFWVVITVMSLITAMMAVQKMNNFMMIAIALLCVIALWTFGNAVMSYHRHCVITQLIHRSLKGRNHPYEYEFIWMDVHFLLDPQLKTSESCRYVNDTHPSDEKIFQYALEKGVRDKYFKEIHPHKPIQSRGYIRLTSRYDQNIEEQGEASPWSHR